ncbi:MAG: 3-dehydroquinate synthase [Trichlorobacter sp.]|jgi:3-dehydroquinate synthase
MSLITVQLGPQSYTILIDAGILAGAGERCRAVGLAGRAAVVTNPTVAALYAETVLSSLTAAGYQPLLIEIPDGEAYKTGQTLNTVYDRLIEGGLDRRCFVVALGGGVVGDLAGFAAATYLRGIPFVQVPTTLLAQVDSSVGGKTGIDHPRGKNLIGAFHQPRLVLADVATLASLPEREYRAGLAEVVKYGVVLDRQFFELLERTVVGLLARDQGVIASVVERCCVLKAWVVEQDEHEAGLRAVLNYGHTLGHAFEALAGYQGLVHGEAVAIGMVLAARISVAEGLCTAAEHDRIVALLRALGLPTVAPRAERDTLIAALTQDKKSRAGVIQYICNQGIGAHAVREFAPAQLAETCVAGR